jgi:hypothetical protein
MVIFPNKTHISSLKNPRSKKISRISRELPARFWGVWEWILMRNREDDVGWMCPNGIRRGWLLMAKTSGLKVQIKLRTSIRRCFRRYQGIVKGSSLQQKSRAQVKADGTRITNSRYSRLPVCATAPLRGNVKQRRSWMKLKGLV